VARFDALFTRLAEHTVEYVIVGGVAATVHGSAYATDDLDLCYERNHQNLSRLVEALAPLHPVLRGAPAGLPFVFDVPTLKAGLNFTLSTDWGDIDLLGEVAGVGAYGQAREASEEFEIFGVSCRVLCLEALIASKRAAGRGKDLKALPELEALLELHRRGDSKQ